MSSPEPPWTPFEEVPIVSDDPMILASFEGTRTFVNSRYQVVSRQFPNKAMGVDMLHLSIKRHDREIIHDWRDLQRIKNEFAGPECEGVELYPAESRLVDSANQYHLWCLPKGLFFQLGFTDRRLVSELNMGKSKQRPWPDDGSRPKDLETPEALQKAIDEYKQKHGKKGG
jgi:hypothetical protein